MLIVLTLFGFIQAPALASPPPEVDSPILIPVRKDPIVEPLRLPGWRPPTSEEQDEGPSYGVEVTTRIPAVLVPAWQHPASDAKDGFGAEWTLWSKWSECKAGQSSRVRGCYTLGGFACYGERMQVRDCTLYRFRPTQIPKTFVAPTIEAPAGMVPVQVDKPMDSSAEGPMDENRQNALPKANEDFVADQLPPRPTGNFVAGQFTDPNIQKHFERAMSGDTNAFFGRTTGASEPGPIPPTGFPSGVLAENSPGISPPGFTDEELEWLRTNSQSLSLDDAYFGKNVHYLSPPKTPVKALDTSDPKEKTAEMVKTLMEYAQHHESKPHPTHKPRAIISLAELWKLLENLNSRNGTDEKKGPQPPAFPIEAPGTGGNAETTNLVENQPKTGVPADLSGVHVVQVQPIDYGTSNDTSTPPPANPLAGLQHGAETGTFANGSAFFSVVTFPPMADAGGYGQQMMEHMKGYGQQMNNAGYGQEQQMHSGYGQQPMDSGYGQQPASAGHHAKAGGHHMKGTGGQSGGSAGAGAMATGANAPPVLTPPPRALPRDPVAHGMGADVATFRLTADDLLGFKAGAPGVPINAPTPAPHKGYPPRPNPYAKVTYGHDKNPSNLTVVDVRKPQPPGIHSGLPADPKDLPKPKELDRNANASAPGFRSDAPGIPIAVPYVNYNYNRPKYVLPQNVVANQVLAHGPKVVPLGPPGTLYGALQLIQNHGPHAANRLQGIVAGHLGGTPQKPGYGPHGPGYLEKKPTIQTEVERPTAAPPSGTGIHYGGANPYFPLPPAYRPEFFTYMVTPKPTTKAPPKTRKTPKPKGGKTMGYGSAPNPTMMGYMAQNRGKRDTGGSSGGGHHPTPAHGHGPPPASQPYPQPPAPMYPPMSSSYKPKETYFQGLYVPIAPGGKQIPDHGFGSRFGNRTALGAEGNKTHTTMEFLSRPGTWTEWSMFSLCNCGTQHRTRSCRYPPGAFQITGCWGRSYEVRNCTGGTCNNGTVPFNTTLIYQYRYPIYWYPKYPFLQAPVFALDSEANNTLGWNRPTLKEQQGIIHAPAPPPHMGGSILAPGSGFGSQHGGGYGTRSQGGYGTQSQGGYGTPTGYE